MPIQVNNLIHKQLVLFASACYHLIPSFQIKKQKEMVKLQSLLEQSVRRVQKLYISALRPYIEKRLNTRYLGPKHPTYQMCNLLSVSSNAITCTRDFTSVESVLMRIKLQYHGQKHSVIDNLELLPRATK